MANLRLKIAITLLLAFTISWARSKDSGMDDLDSFFDDVDDGFVPDEPTANYDNFESVDSSTPTPDEILEMMVEEDPVPEFESASEKYLFYARRYLTEV